MKKKIVLLAFVFASSFLFNRVVAQAVNISDSLALVDLYNSTGGKHWTNHTNWLTKKPVGQWYGITAANNRVSRIYLYQNKMTGFLPLSLGNLSQLTYLDLADNRFTVDSGIPESVSNLSELDTLNLAYDYLGGAFPSKLAKLSKLKFVNLSWNRLTDSIPSSIGFLTNCEVLYLDYNYLKGNIPLALTQLPNLHYFSVAVNKLSGPIPPELANLSKLTDLDLSNNRFSGSIPAELANLRHLKSLTLNYNELSGTIPEELGNLSKLTELLLSGNHLSGAIPRSLGNLSNLYYLNLANNDLEGTIPSSFGSLRRLEHLYMGGNKLKGEVPLGVITLPELYDVDFSRNRLTQYDNAYPDNAKINIDQWNLGSNRYTFNGLEYLASARQDYQSFNFLPQAPIPIHLFQHKLAVSAGGTLQNNTYHWTKAGETSSQVITGDSTFQPLTSGTYYASITNSVVKTLTLTTDTFSYVMLLAKNELNISISPNPARGMIGIYGFNEKSDARITIADMSGYVWVRVMSRQQSAMKVNVSQLKAGNYLVSVSDGKEVKTVMFVKE